MLKGKEGRVYGDKKEIKSERKMTIRNKKRKNIEQVKMQKEQKGGVINRRCKSTQKGNQGRVQMIKK